MSVLSPRWRAIPDCGANRSLLEGRCGRNRGRLCRDNDAHRSRTRRRTGLGHVFGKHELVLLVALAGPAGNSTDVVQWTGRIKTHGSVSKERQKVRLWCAKCPGNKVAQTSAVRSVSCRPSAAASRCSSAMRAARVYGSIGTTRKRSRNFVQIFFACSNSFSLRCTYSAT